MQRNNKSHPKVYWGERPTISELNLSVGLPNRKGKPKEKENPPAQNINYTPSKLKSPVPVPTIHIRP